MKIQSVCLYVKRVLCDKTQENSAQIFIPYERSFSLNIGVAMGCTCIPRAEKKIGTVIYWDKL